MLLVLAEYIAELLAEHGFFFPAFDPISGQHQAYTEDTSPLVDDEGRAYRRQNQAGVDGVPQMSVGTSADELVVFLDGDPRTPILCQMIAGPDRQSNA